MDLFPTTYIAPTAQPPRVTYDVDLIAVVAALRNYHALAERFAGRGFTRDISPDAPICRWRIGGIAVDLMPADESVLTLEQRLAQYDPERHGGEVMADTPIGAEKW